MAKRGPGGYTQAMKIALLALSVLAALPAFADDPKPYIVVNGKGASGPPASSGGSGGFVRAGTAPSAFGTNAVHPGASGLDAGTAAALAAAGVGGGAAAAPSQDRSFAGRRISGRKTRGITSKTRRGASDSDIPPNYTKPGALIRTEGQLPVYSDPGNARTTSVEGGSFVDINPKYARGAAVAPGITWGKPDTPPPPSPTSGGSGAGGNGVSANGPAIIDNSHSNNINGNQNGGSGNGNGNGNGNGGGNGNSSQTGFDPAF